MTQSGIAAVTARLMSLALAVLLCAAPATADPVADFYKDKRITLIIGNTTGGINDVVGRLVGRHIGKHIPGNPTVVPQNMPGAGGLLAMNHLYNVVAKDGLTIGNTGRAVPQLAFIGDANVRFDPVKFTWLGSTSSYANDSYLLLLNATHPARNVADLRKPGVSTKVGSLNTGTSNLIYALIAKEVLGFNLEVVRGYAGGAAIFLAMQRGEVDGQFVGLSTLLSSQKQLWEGGAFRPLVQFGRTNRLAALPDVPVGRELTTDPDSQALIDFADLPFFMALPFLAPPDLPKDRADALQAAFLATHKDPEFIADAAKLGVDVSPIGGGRIRELLTRSAATPKAVIERYNKIAN